MIHRKLRIVWAEFPVIRVVNVPKGQGGEGKCRTLNNGFKYAQGELIAVYDVDGTPESNCVRLIAKPNWQIRALSLSMERYVTYELERQCSQYLYCN